MSLSQPLYKLIASALLVILVGCAPIQYSEDPLIKQTQQWAIACNQVGQTIVTATMLRNDGHLTQLEIDSVDLIDRVYRPVCTGDPGPLGEIVRDALVEAAVADLCPELVVSDDAAITILQAAACASRKALLLQLEAK